MRKDLIPLGFDDRYLLDSSPRQIFALGAEWANFYLKLLLPGADEQQVHSIQAEMLVDLANIHERVVTRQWVNDDWVLLKIEADNGDKAP